MAGTANNLEGTGRRQIPEEATLNLTYSKGLSAYVEEHEAVL